MHESAIDLAEFERILGIGLGRAVLTPLKADPPAFRQIILAACLHNGSYDPQVEGSRAPYLLDVIAQTEDEDFYRQPILDALPSCTAYHDSEQLLDFASSFARRGDDTAKQAIYARFTADVVTGGFSGASHLVECGGTEALMFVAEKFGEYELSGQGRDEPYLDPYLPYLNAQPAERAALEREAAKNASIAAYVAAARLMDRSSAPVRPRAERALTYREIKRTIGSGNRPSGGDYYLRTWGRRASSRQINAAAADLLVQDDPKRLAAYLRIFDKRVFPLNPQKLIELSRGPHLEIATRAMGALSNVTHESVRQLALELLAPNERRAEGVGLLACNYRPGDCDIIAAALTTTSELDVERYHDIGFALLDVANTNPLPEFSEVLLTLYERGPCSQCRSQAVRLLHEVGSLPA